MKIKILKNTILITLVISLFAFTAHTAIAAEASKSASPSSSLADKIKALKNEIASKASELKNEVTKKLQNKALIGSVLSTEDSKLSISTKNGNKNIQTDEYTEYISAGKKITLKDIKADDYIAALGDIDDKNTLKAKRIVKLTKPKESTSKLIWGQIETATNPNITLKTQDSKNIQVTTSSNTIFFLGIAESSFLDAKSGKFLIARGELSGNTLKATYVYYIPAMGYIKPEKKVASQSATASPSATPKKK